MKRLIHKQARESLQALLPNLDTYDCKCQKEVHWNLFRVFAFNHYIDKDSGAVRIGAETIARAVGKMDELKFRHFNAGKYITHFINDIIPGCATLVLDEQGREWSKSTWGFSGSRFVKEDEGKQRRVLLHWSPEVKEILRKETHGEFTGEKVYISTGNKKNKTKERSVLKAVEDECQQEIEILNCEPAKEIAQYLNSLPTNCFTKLVDNYEETKAEILKIKNENVRNQQLLILDSIMEAPKPFVKPTERTDRLFGHGANITNLKKDIRRSFTKGWYEADLRSAQLAIVAKLWDIPEVTEFLKTGKSFWKEVLSFLGADTEAKSLVKDYTYGTIFGMSKDRIQAELNIGLKEFGVEDGGDKFLSHPLISTLLKARTKYVSLVTSLGSLIDAFGVEFKVTKSNVLSLVARQAQSYEMALIYPIFGLAGEDFSVTLYQFDGVSLKFHNERNKAHWLERICEVVEEKALELGIHTSLEISENTDKFTLLEERKVQKKFELLTLVEEKKNDLPHSTTGIYCIFDTSSSRAYFGQSVDVYSRVLRHRSDLVSNRHNNKKLQRAFNKSPGNLVGFLAQEVDYSQLDEAESFYINYFKTHKYGFNQVNKLR